MSNIELSGRAHLTLFRHISLGTWRTAYDPSIYGMMTVRMDECMRYIEEFRAARGVRLTVTHMMARAIGAVLEQVPEANAVLRWNRLYLRKGVGVFFQVAIEDPETGAIDLSGLKLDDPQRRSLVEIAEEFEKSAARVRGRRKDDALERSRGGLRLIPAAFIGAALRLLAFVNYTLNLDLRWAGIPRDPFGGAMVTNIGSLGLESAFVPLVPFSRVPILVAMGAVERAAVVDDGEIHAAQIMRICATFDHRVIDGAHAAKMAKILRGYFEHPYAHFEPPGP